VVAGPVRVTAAAVSSHSVPGLVAVSIAALISIAAWAGRALSGGMSTALLLAGLIAPLLVVTAVVVAQRLLPVVTGWDSVWQFTVRTANGVLVQATLRTDVPPAALRSGDLVRVTPSSSVLNRVAPGRHSQVRIVEVLAARNGPVTRRIAATAALPPAQLLGLGLAVALLAATAAMVLLL
jgi:hypothetical protein